MRDHKSIVQRFLSKASVEINGNQPWDIRVHNPEFYKRVLTEGTLGLGESYMAGWWTCKAVDQFFYKIIKANLHNSIHTPFIKKTSNTINRLFNMQKRNSSNNVANKHYNPDSEIILSFLDSYNQYTCGYFKDTNYLSKAQEQKLDLICKKLLLMQDDSVLDIGCGWGGFARFAAERYTCKVTGISISSKQIEYARRFCAGLPVEFKMADYRKLSGSYSKILICGMIEHVGYKNYRILMEIVYNCLENNGLLLLHTIGGNTSQISGDPWLLKYFFPNSMIPSIKQIVAATEGLFILEDVHNIGQHYDPTLMAWHTNFTHTWEKIQDQYDESFYRMWTYYFLHMAGTFRGRLNHVWQFVFSKGGLPEVYHPVR